MLRQAAAAGLVVAGVTAGVVALGDVQETQTLKAAARASASASNRPALPPLRDRVVAAVSTAPATSAEVPASAQAAPPADPPAAGPAVAAPPAPAAAAPSTAAAAPAPAPPTSAAPPKVTRTPRPPWTTAPTVAPSPTEPPAVSAADIGKRMTGLVNAARRSAGRPPLRVDVRLRESARSWSEQMVSDGELSHDPALAQRMPDGATAWGENVAYRSTGPDMATGLHEQFMNSDAHRENLLNPAFTHVGIGVAQGHGLTYVTERFAAGI